MHANEEHCQCHCVDDTLVDDVFASLLAPQFRVAQGDDDDEDVADDACHGEGGAEAAQDIRERSLPEFVG